jgi:hypothetical protein
MITEWLLYFLGSVAEALLELIPGAPERQPAVDGFQQGIGTVVAYAGAFGHWIPWNVVGPVCLLVFGALVASGGIKLVRIVLSFLTLGGGSAA